MHRAIDWYALRQIIRLALLVSLIALLVPLGHTQAQRSTPIIYVRPVANGTGDGSSWANATTFQDALRQATAGSEIWVAAGVYVAGADPRDTFAPRNGVALYGGFAGNETSREQRDPSTNLTVLSGDLGADDQNKQQGITPTPDDIVGVNTRNIVTTPNLADPNTIIDGFTITGGQAGSFTSNSSGCPAACGGGIFVANGSPTLRNIHLVGNQARNLGGGIYLGGQSVTLHNLHFSHNRAERGGGLAIMKGLVTLQGVRFEANEARSGTGSGAGGGLFIGDSLPGQRIQVTVRQGYFSGNRALIGAGAIELGQATLTMSESSLLANGERFVPIPGVRRVEALGGIGVNNGTLQLTNVRLAGNEGGALRVQRTLNVAQAGEAQLTNVSIEGNRAETFSGGINCTVCRLTAVNVSIAGNLGGGIAPGGIFAGAVNSVGERASLDLHNTVVWGNWSSYTSPLAQSDFGYDPEGALNVSHSLIRAFNLPGPGNLDGTRLENDPRFVAAPDPLATPQQAGDLRVQAGSPLIDVGANTRNLTQTDLTGGPRLLNGQIDIGAYEFGDPNLSIQLDPASDSGVRNDDGITNVATPRLRGQAGPGQTLEVRSSLDGTIGTTVADADGNWQLTAPPLREGQHALTVLANDVPSAPLLISLDFTAPLIRLSFSQSLDYFVRGSIIDDRHSGLAGDGLFGLSRANLRLSPERPVELAVFDLVRRVEGFYQIQIYHRQPGSASVTVRVQFIPSPEVTDAAGNPAQDATETNYAFLPPNTNDRISLCPALFIAEIEPTARAERGSLAQNDRADEPLDLAILYRLRDQVLSASDEGQRLTAAYYAHAGEVAYLLVTDEALRDQAVATVKGWQPAIRALVYGSGAQITLSVEQAAATERFLDALAAAGSPELAQMLASERATVGLERLIGQSMDDAIRTVIGVDPATLGLAPHIYLPLLRR